MVIKGTAEYDGTDLFGWQVQKGKRTAQGLLIESIKKILGNIDFKLIGASRTDAGVHAEEQTFSLHLKDSIPMEVSKLADAMNAVLPEDIYVRSMAVADGNFHARFSAHSKVYRYRILDGRRSPLRSRYVWELPYSLDLEILKACAFLIEREVDFSFLKMTHEKKFRKVQFYSSSWERKDDELVFTIEGGYFLYKLVRVLVGSMVYSVRKYSSEGFFKRFLKGQENRVIVSPAKGLTLVTVRY